MLWSTNIWKGRLDTFLCIIYSLIQTAVTPTFLHQNNELKTEEWTLALALVAHIQKTPYLNSKLRYSIHQRACLFHFPYTVPIRLTSTQAHKEWKSFSRWALPSAPCISSNRFFLPVNPVFWKHCYYPPVAHCTDECLSILSPMFLSQSLSKCWINQPFNSRSYHEASKLHDRPFAIPTVFLLFFQQRHLPSVDSGVCTLVEAFRWLLYILISFNNCKPCLCKEILNCKP